MNIIPSVFVVGHGVNQRCRQSSFCTGRHGRASVSRTLRTGPTISRTESMISIDSSRHMIRMIIDSRSSGQYQRFLASSHSVNVLTWWGSRTQMLMMTDAVALGTGVRMDRRDRCGTWWNHDDILRFGYLWRWWRWSGHLSIWCLLSCCCSGCGCGERLRLQESLLHRM